MWFRRPPDRFAVVRCDQLISNMPAQTLLGCHIPQALGPQGCLPLSAVKPRSAQVIDCPAGELDLGHELGLRPTSALATFRLACLSESCDYAPWRKKQCRGSLRWEPPAQKGSTTSQ